MMMSYLSTCLNKQIYMQTTMTYPKMKRKERVNEAYLTGQEKQGRGGDRRRRERGEERGRTEEEEGEKGGAAVAKGEEKGNKKNKQGVFSPSLLMISVALVVMLPWHLFVGFYPRLIDFKFFSQFLHISTSPDSNTITVATTIQTWLLPLFHPIPHQLLTFCVLPTLKLYRHCG